MSVSGEAGIVVLPHLLHEDNALDHERRWRTGSRYLGSTEKILAFLRNQNPDRGASKPGLPV